MSRRDEQLQFLISISESSDIVVARQRGRELARAEGWPAVEIEALAIAISEVARNILVHAGSGEMALGIETDGGRRSIVVVARDEGPGIPDVQRAMEDGYSTKRGLGLGLSGARRLMDELQISSAAGSGTTITMKKCVAGASNERV